MNFLKVLTVATLMFTVTSCAHKSNYSKSCSSKSSCSKEKECCKKKSCKKDAMKSCSKKKAE